jgi:hypothetical protein
VFVFVFVGFFVVVDGVVFPSDDLRHRDTMETFDDAIVGRKFDNFQFVPFSAAVTSRLPLEAEINFRYNFYY